MPFFNHRQFGFRLVPALVLRLEAAGQEWAFLGQLDHVGRGPGQGLNSLAGVVQSRQRLQQRPGVGVLGAAEQRDNFRAFHHVSRVDHAHLVGHGGKLDAAILACESVDRNLAKLLPVLQEHGYDWIITADHGNAEEMYYPGTEKICPSHTTNQVQTFVHSQMISSSDQLKKYVGLKDIAPLVLELMELDVPQEMQS